MKKIIFLSIALISSGFTMADEHSKDNEHRMPPHMMMKQHISKFDSELDLTDEQKSKIKEIREKYKETHKQSREAEMNEIKSILTPEQRKKADEMHAQMKEKIKEQMKERFSKNKKDVSQ